MLRKNPNDFLANPIHSCFLCHILTDHKCVSSFLGSLFCSTDLYMFLCQYHDEAGILEKYREQQVVKARRETQVQDHKMHILFFSSVPPVGSATVYVTLWGDDIQSPHLKPFTIWPEPMSLPGPCGTGPGGRQSKHLGPPTNKEGSKELVYLWKVLAKSEFFPTAWP